jgi:indole-3-glycerol phosphate synthase
MRYPDTILGKIVADKLQEVTQKKKLVPLEDLRNRAIYQRPRISVVERFKENPGIIAEHKRRSPSKPSINQKLGVEEVVQGYAQAGARALSILTDGKYFGGSTDDLILARASCALPLLRKDFVVDSYQITEARAYGADFILLIGSVLEHDEINEMAAFAQEEGMDVLLEIHQADELPEDLHSGIGLVGVNNRDLRTFDVSLETSKQLAERIPQDRIRISESGISSAEAIDELVSYGYSGFLVGESLMKTKEPGKSLEQLIESTTALTK